MKYRRSARPSFLRSTQNQKGFTLVEALLAMGLVAIIALGSVTFFSEMSKFSHQSRESCRLYNSEFLDRIRSYGAAGTVGVFAPMPGAGNQVVPKTDPSVPSPVDLDLNIRWPSDAPILAQNTDLMNPQPREFNNYLLINGYMNILATLYNQHPDICNNFVSIGNTSTASATNRLMIPYPEGMVDPTGGSGMRIKITPYNVDTGERACEPRPLRVAPRPKFLNDNDPLSTYNTADSNFGTSRKITKPLAVKQNIGFSVQVESQFRNDNQTIDRCLTEERFQYNIDSKPPPAPNLLAAQMTAVTDICTAHSKNDLILDIGYDATIGDIEAGSIILCQDMSVKPTTARYVPASTPGAQAAILDCYIDKPPAPGNPPDFAPSGPQISDNMSPGYFPVEGSPSGGRFDYTSPTRQELGIRRWRPCNELTICGHAPTSVVTAIPGPVDPVADTSNKTSRLAYRLHYNDLPSDCRIVVKMTAVDPAGNASPDKDSDTYAKVYNAPTDTSSDFILNWDVPRPKCRYFCPSTTETWPTGGYFTCSTSGC